jgi:hypothetical protein
VLSLSRFLRYTLARTPSQLTTLADEIGMLRQYLEIEAARFSDRLKVTWEVPARLHAGDGAQPVLLPLVENALKYGLGGSERPVEIVDPRAPRGRPSGAWRRRRRRQRHGNAGGGLGIGLSNCPPAARGPVRR